MDNKELLSEISEMLEVQTRHIEAQLERVGAQIKRLETKMENEVTQKLETLFDGYKPSQEEPWELERKLA